MIETDKTYYACVRCANFFSSTTDLVTIVSGKEMSAIWCNDCVTKHLNTREVKE